MPSFDAFSLEEIFAALGEWLDISNPMDACRFLENHPELLSPRCQAILERMSADFAERVREFQSMIGGTSAEVEAEINKFREHIDLLRDVHRRGGTIRAIREAYVDVFGGLVLNMPSWLSRSLQEAATLIAAAMPAQSTNEGIMLLREVIAHASAEPDIVSEILAELHLTLQEILEEAIDANQREVQEERIACLKAALPVYTLVRYPRHYAHVQHKLGVIYKQRMEGDQQHNLADAAKYFTNALQVYTLDAFPKDYAMNQYNLGNTLMVMHLGRANKQSQEHLKEAITCFNTALQVYTRAAFPFEYAKTQQCLGTTYSDFVEGERFTHMDRALGHFNRALDVFTLEEYPLNYAEIHYLLALLHNERIEHDRPNALEESIHSCQCTLQVYTLASFPEDYAKVQRTMGELYMRRVAGTRETNIEEAIACYNRALQVFTLDDYPGDYAEAQNLLGNAYNERIAGVHQDNQEEATAYYHRALQGFKLRDNAKGYAKIQYNLAIVYSDRIEGDRADNLEKAISYCMRALEFYIRDSFPEDYAQVQNTLGTIYKERIRGERRANLQEAINYHHRALQIYTLTRFPKGYAETQHNMGNAYMNRVEGEARDNVEEAIKCYQLALQVFTVDDFPVQYASTLNQLGIAYRERIDGDRRANQEEAIKCFERALQVLTPEAFPVDYTRVQHNLANVYKERIAGTQQENQEAAILHYTQAIQADTRQNYPRGYAMSHDAVGVIYSHRIAGDRRTNLEKAIAHHKAALEVFTRETYPMDYAKTQINLGITYTSRVEGKRSANLGKAVVCCKAALEVFTREAYPINYTTAQSNLGAAYMMMVAGEQRYNLEFAIDCYEKALQVATPETLPVVYAEIQNNLGVAYRERVKGEHWENLERSIACHRAALQVLTLDASPLDYGRTQNNLGAAYMERVLGERWENVERAIECFKKSLSAYATDPTSLYYAATHINLGVAYTRRRRGDRRTNLEDAIECYKKALQIYKLDTFPLEYARTQINLGNAIYMQRREGEKPADFDEAISCFSRALQVFTLDAFPREHRDAQLNLAFAETMRQNWEAAHKAYTSAVAAEDLLVALGAGVTGRDAILQEGRDAAISNGFVLAHLSRIPEAAISIERGRARGLAESMALNAANPVLIASEERRVRYEAARKNLISTQAALNASFRLYDDPDIAFPELLPRTQERIERKADLRLTAAYQQAKATFDAIVAEIHEAQDPPDFLNMGVDVTTILRAAERCGPGHALMYLAATLWGGIAIGAFSGDPAMKTQARFASLTLPELTEAYVDDLVEARLSTGTRPAISGFAAAQEAGTGIERFLHDWSGATFRERAMALHEACSTVGTMSTFDETAQEVLRNSRWAEIVDSPLDQVDPQELSLLESTMEHLLLQNELRRCLEALAQAALRPMVAWLQDEGTKSCTLIPCGPIAAFPLLTIEVYPGQTIGDLLEISVAPSARSLLYDTVHRTERSGVYALGNPWPTHQDLQWGEAEALTIAKLARTLNVDGGGQAKIQHQATGKWLRDVLRHGLIVDASCHGVFDTDDFRQSALLLANGQRLLLAALLSHEVDLRGLRLLILSACQTAVLDLRGAVNEVRSLAAGVLQSGARAVLASLWSVDDRATYLLMVRFVQEWFPRMNDEAPAAALSRAQRWLRTVTNRELLTWYVTMLPVLTKEERIEAGSGTSTPDNELVKAQEPVNIKKMAAVRGRGNRYTIGEAEKEVHDKAKQEVDPDACPYEDPIYWAGFQITGW